MKRDTFHGDEDAGREGHDLRGAAGGRIFGEEFAIDLVDDAEVVAGDHENGGLDDFAEAAAGFFQNYFDVLKSLPGLVFEVVADDFASVEVETGGAGDEDEVVGDDGLGEGLAHAGGFRGVEVKLRHGEFY